MIIFDTKRLKSSLALLLSIAMIFSGLSLDCQARDEVGTDNIARAMEAADLLGIRSQVEEIHSYQSSHDGPESQPLRIVSLRNKSYRAIMGGVCDVRVATNKIERELTYTYDQYRREVSKVQSVSGMFNLLNFAQFSVFHSLEGLSRREDQFNQSAILLAVSSGLGLLLPSMNILYAKRAKRKVEPPGRYATIVEGGSVTDLKMPKLVARFMSSRAPGTSKTRRELMYSTWKERYGTDAMAQDALFSLLNGKRMGRNELYKRIVHLWSLHMFVQELNHELLALQRYVQPPSVGACQEDAASLALNKSGIVACKLLGIETELSEYVALSKSGSNLARKVELETNLIGRILLASLEARSASDKCNEEMNYAYDVVLADLQARRANQLQLSYEANFIQKHTFGAIASGCFLNQHTKAGNVLFTIDGSIGAALTTLGVLILRGGKRRIDTPPIHLLIFSN